MNKYFRLVFCIVLLTSTVFVSAQESAPKESASQVKGTRRALLIAVSNYMAKKDFRALPSADADIELMKKELLDSGFEADNICVLQNHRAMPSRENIIDSIKGFAESCGSEDLAFIMLTGHGLRDAKTQKDYFIPLDAKKGDVNTYVPLKFVIEALESSGAKFKWLLVDACREIGKGSNDGSSLGNLDAKPGMLIFQSSSPGEISYTTEIDGSGNGLFVYHFVEGLQGKAIGDDGRVTVLDAFKYARKKIESRQIPVMSSKDFNDFVLNEKEDWTRAAKYAQQAQVYFDNNNLNQARIAINTALIYDTPLHDAYLKKAELIDRLLGLHLPQDYTDMNGSEFRLIKAGSFTMGSKLTDEEIVKKYNVNHPEWYRDAPLHQVALTQNFYLCKYPVTRGEFRKFVDATHYKTTAEKKGSALVYDKKGNLGYVAGANWNNCGFKQTDSHPVVCVSYDDALAYIAWLNANSKSDDKLGGSKPTYRLPTEAEWEYSCRAGTTGEFFWGDEEYEGEGFLNAADETKNPAGKDWPYHFSFSDGFGATSPVGKFNPNPWGLYDMLGNVVEWTSDYYGEYPIDDVTDPQGASTGKSRVLRGGGCYSFPAHCRCASRGDAPPDRCGLLGFRVAFSLTSK